MEGQRPRNEPSSLKTLTLGPKQISDFKLEFDLSQDFGNQKSDT